MDFMSNQLRKGVEKLKLYYINQLIQLDYYSASKQKLHSLTLSELEDIFKKVFPSNEYALVPKSNQCKES